MNQACQRVAQSPMNDMQTSSAEDPQPRYITQLGSNDVLVAVPTLLSDVVYLSLLARGAPSNLHEGNIRYRELVRLRRPEYLTTKIRLVKDRIAREIVNTVHERGGMFVRPVESLDEAQRLGVPRGVAAYAAVPQESVLFKVKQAMRDDRRVRGARGGGTSDDNQDSEENEGSNQQQEEDRKLPAVDRGADVNVALQRPLTALQATPGLPYIADQRPYAATAAAAAMPDASVAALLSNPQSLLATLQSLQTTQRDLYPLQPLFAFSPTFPSTGDELPSLLNQHQQRQTSASGTNIVERVLQALAEQLCSSSAGVAHGSRFSLQVASQDSCELWTRRPQRQEQQDHHPQQQQQIEQQRPRQQKKHRKKQIETLHTQQRQYEMKGDTRKHGSKAEADRLLVETEGNAAIRAACEQDEGATSDVCLGWSHDFLRLNLTEILILTALCSHGLPSWTANADVSDSLGRSDSSKPNGNIFTWIGFAELLEDILGEWEVLDASQRGRLRDGSIDADHFDRIFAATGQHVDKIIQDLDELPRRVVSLVECLVRFVYRPSSLTGAIDGEKTEKFTNSEPSMVNYEAWFIDELCRWAISIGVSAPVNAGTISGSGIRPIPCCVSAFMANLPRSSATQKQQDSLLFSLCSFDRDNAGVVLNQIACVTRFRDIVEKKATGAGIVALNLMVSDAVQELNRSKKIWKGKPSWWGATSTNKNPVEDDLTLVMKLGRDGFRGVLQDDSSIHSRWQNLTITAVEERGRQLLPLLHAYQVEEDRTRLLEERKNRFIEDNDLQTTAIARAKRPRA